MHSVLELEAMKSFSVFVFDGLMRYLAIFGDALRRHDFDPDELLGNRADEVLPEES